MERIAMSQEERDWLEWLNRVRDGMVTQNAAAAKLGMIETGLWKIRSRGLLESATQLLRRVSAV